MKTFFQEFVRDDAANTKVMVEYFWEDGTCPVVKDCVARG